MSRIVKGASSLTAFWLGHHGFALLCLSPWSPRVRANRGAFNLCASIADDPAHKMLYPYYLCEECDARSYSGGSVAHARSYARIDGRDQAIMTRHILSTLAPIPPITRSSQLLANRRAERSSLLTRHPHVLTAPSSQPLLISPRTLDPISFSPLVPTLFPLCESIANCCRLAAIRVCAFPSSHNVIFNANKLKSCLDSGTPRRQGKLSIPHPTPRPCCKQQASKSRGSAFARVDHHGQPPATHHYT